ncbi:hypothetical protein GGS24DRAFT_205088 [Hypoxylon argillaceum]|nr:hypothetical protein GGS24DRAFT_205088 [Hypoxylon argillaceum]
MWLTLLIFLFAEVPKVPCKYAFLILRLYETVERVHVETYISSYMFKYVVNTVRHIDPSYRNRFGRPSFVFEGQRRS